MAGDLKEFWKRHLQGVDVAVASTSPEVLLGVRDGFQRFLGTSFDVLVPVAIVAQPPADSAAGLTLSDRETLELARERAAAAEASAEESQADQHHFYVGAEGGLHRLELDQAPAAYFVCCWAAVRGLGDETWGSSASLQVPPHLVAGLERDDVSSALPATRRRGGLLSALSQGRETRRTAVALAVFNALTTRFFGVLGSRLPYR